MFVEKYYTLILSFIFIIHDNKYFIIHTLFYLQTNREGSGTMNLGGSLTRQVEQDAPVSEASPHIANIGRMVEDMENKIR